MNFARFFSVVLIAVIFNVPLFAQEKGAALPAGVAKITSVEGISEYRFPNGLTALIAPDPSKPSITVNITYKVGSRHENYGETGMAHLLEHMLFKGTKRYPKITDEFTKRGARWNATTWVDRTNYYEVFTASDANLDWALSIEADRMVNSRIRKEDLMTEMPVVRNEFEIGENNPVYIMAERIVSTMYLWHNYGKSTIGARSDIENVPIPRLQAFYREHYQPDNAVLLVSGRIDETKTLALIAKHFGLIPKPKRVLQALYTREPTQDGERFIKLERVGDIQAVGAGFHVPPMAHADYPLTLLLSEILINTPSGRLHKALIDTKKATSVAGYNFENHDPSVALFWAELRKEQSLDEVRDIFIKTLEGFVANPVSKEEIERARSKFLKEIELTVNTSEKLGLNLSEAIGAGDWRLFFLTRDRLRAAKPEDVQRAALMYLKPSNRTVGLFIPTAKPERTDVPIVADVNSVLKNYQGDPPIAKGEAFDATPENIEKRLKRGELSGGMKTALLAKKTRGETVNAQIILRFGDENNLKNQRVAADLAGGMLMRGTSQHTRQQLTDEMDKLKARITINGGAAQAVASIEAKRETLPAALKLAAEMLRESTLPENEFELLRQEALADLERELSDPASRAREAIGTHFNHYPKDDARYYATTEENIAGYKAVKWQDVKAFYQNFYGSNNGQLAIVGDFDEKAINALLPSLFGNWKSMRPFKQLTDEYRTVAAASKKIETPDKESATFIARINVNLNEDDPDYAALKMADWVLGSGAGFSSRLVARIRVKEGLSYAVRSQLGVTPFDRAGYWMALAQYAPQNKAKVEAAFRDEMGKLVMEGFATSEISNAKSGYAQAQQLARSNDGRLAANLATKLYLGRTMNWDAALDKKVEMLKATDIQAAIKKYLDAGQMTIVNAGDFVKSAK